MLLVQGNSSAAHNLRQPSVIRKPFFWTIATLGAAGACAAALRRVLPRPSSKASTKPKPQTFIGQAHRHMSVASLPRCIPALPRTMTTEAPQGPQAKFDLALTATLAGKAFESYLAPAGAEGFQDVNMDGTETTYTDPDFLASTFAGILKVTLERAEGLPGSDRDGNSAPRVVLSVGESCGRSSVVHGNLNPTWDETFYLYVKARQEPLLHVRVYDDDRLTADDALGKGSMDIGDLLPGQERGYKVVLRGTGGGGAGSVHLKASYLPFYDEDSPLVQQLVADDTADPDKVKDPDPTSTAIPKPTENGTQQADPKQNGTQQVPRAVPAAPTSRVQARQDIVNRVNQERANSFKRALQRNATPQPTSPKANTTAEQAEPDMTVQLGRAAPAQAAADASEQIAQLTGQQLPQAWRALASVAGLLDKQCSQLLPVAYVDSPGTDTQAWLYRSQASREVVVAFRGTQLSRIKDVITDLKLIPTNLEKRLQKRKRSGFLASIAETVKAVMGLTTEEKMVHDGFLDAMESVKSKVYKLVDQLTADRDGGRWKVYWIGHSLGGALATLAAHETASYKFQARVNYDVMMYTYGAPRVGNKAFADSFNKRVPDSWRITNYNDLVATVPRRMGYWHVRHGVRLTADGRFKFETEGTPDNVVLDIGAELVDSSSQTSAEARESLNAEEMTWLERLVGGDAQEHMEPNYLVTLKAALLTARPDLKEEMEAEMAAVLPVQQPAEGAAAAGEAAANGTAAVQQAAAPAGKQDG